MKRVCLNLLSSVMIISQLSGCTSSDIEDLNKVILNDIDDAQIIDEVSVDNEGEEYILTSPIEKPNESEYEYTSVEKEEMTKFSGKIVMPNSTSDYISSEWTIETITEHFKELGFTNIRTVPCKPDDDNYEINIRDVVIETGLFSTDPWEAGDEFDQEDEISIYYNEFPLLTIDNCSDLLKVLTSKEMDYATFCRKYDGRYVKFDAYVIGHTIYDGGTSHIIDVAGGDYDGQTEIDVYNPSTYAGLNIRIGDRAWGNAIDESVEIGDCVTVSGRIDKSWAKYFECLYVETIDLSKR